MNELLFSLPDSQQTNANHWQGRNGLLPIIHYFFIFVKGYEKKYLNLAFLVLVRRLKLKIKGLATIKVQKNKVASGWEKLTRAR